MADNFDSMPLSAPEGDEQTAPPSLRLSRIFVKPGDRAHIYDIISTFIEAYEHDGTGSQHALKILQEEYDAASNKLGRSIEVAINLRETLPLGRALIEAFDVVRPEERALLVPVTGAPGEREAKIDVTLLRAAYRSIERIEQDKP